MVIVHVYIHIKSEYIEPFKEATIENARNSIQEPGIVRFDFIQQQDDSSRFMLIEIYRSPQAIDAHKDAGHYRKWRDTVEIMMAEPRHSIKYSNIHPHDTDWK